MHRKALGRGLEALIPAAAEPGEGGAAGQRLLPIAEVAPSPFQPRTRFDDARSEERRVGKECRL